MSTLTACLDIWAEKQPNTLLYAFYNKNGEVTRQYTYRQFAQETACLAHHLRAQGLKKGDRVILLHPPGLELMVALFACSRIGVITAVTAMTGSSSWESSATRSRISGMIADCLPVGALVTSEQFAKLASEPEFLQGTPLLVTDAPLPLCHPWHDDTHEVFLLQYTSGSTSTPKGVIVRHDNIINNATAFLSHVPIAVSWLPQFHDMGLIGLYLFPVVLGGSSHCFSPTAFL